MTEARVRMPRLLREAESGGRRELREAGRLRPLALEAEMNLYPLSRAEMVLHERDLPLKIHDLVELYGLNGSLGVFRVTAIEREYGRKRRVRLSHGLDTLADAVLANGAAGGTLAEALGQALAAQNSVRWRLGTVEDAGTYDGTEAGDTALAYVTALARQAAGGRLTCDMGEYPWVLGYASDSGRVESEFRLGRNLDECQMTLDDSLLCTRLRVTVETWEDEEPRTVEEVYDDPAGQAAWGVIEKCVRLDGVDDRAGWARQYFARYGQPETQIRISGRELFRLTGERLDETRLGTLCRVALPDHGAVLEERIVSVRYADLLRRPEEVTVCLAAKAQEMGGALAGLRRSEARTARRVDTAEREIIRQRVETGLRLSAHDRHITQYGEILHAAGLEIDPHGVWLYAGEDGPNYALGASFKVQADAISSEVSRATNAESGLSGSISTVKQTADSVSLEVRNARAGEATLGARFAVVVNQIVSEVTDRTNADSALSSRITQTAESITSEVERATNAESGLSGSISTVKQTADSVSLEVANARGDSPTLVSRLQVLSNAITSEVTDRTNADSTLSSRITQTAESITSEVERATNAESGLSGSISTVKQTADSVSVEVRNARGDSATLVARLTVLNNAITSEVTDRTDADSALSSRITQTADAITSEVSRATNAESGLSGSISTVKQTADSVSAEVRNARGDSATLVARLQVLSDAITSEVSRAENAESGLSGSISTVKQTADSVSAEVANARGDSATLVARLQVLNNAITSEVSDRTNADSTLSSRITQNADAITSKVSAGEIASTINQTAQEVLIQASKINLNGYVTASQLNSTLSEARYVYATSLDVSGTLWYKDRSAGWMSQKVVTGLSTTTATFLDTNGAMKTIRYLTSTPSTTTIYYLGESGAA